MSTFRQIQRALGVVVRQKRQRRNWSLRDLENFSRVRRGSLSKIESGKANPCLRTLEKLAEAFDQSPMEFVRQVCDVAAARRTKRAP